MSGARSATIDPAILAQLERAQLETADEREWWAIDARRLARRVAEDVGLGAHAAAIGAVADRAVGHAAPEERVFLIGAAFYRASRGATNRLAAFERLCCIASDMARAWACTSLLADPAIEPRDHIVLITRFATDRSPRVRATAAETLRRVLQRADAAVVDEARARLGGDDDPRIRACLAAALCAAGGADGG